jgi:hypothetical protein
VSGGGLPEGVRRLIHEHIDSVEQMEVLLLLRREPTPWTPEAVARELRIETGSALKRLEDLERRGFLECVDRACAEHQYAPVPPERDRPYSDLRRRVPAEKGGGLRWLTSSICCAR